MAIQPKPTKQHGETLSMDDLRKCIHCGLCTSACPTYLELGSEVDSPRGRIHLMRAVAEGRAQWTPDVVQHLDLCLECRACETACPSGVPYGSLLESARNEIASVKLPRTLKERLVHGLLRDRLFPYANRLRLAFWPMRYAGRLIQRLARLLPSDLRRMIGLLPPIPQDTRAYELPELLPAVGETKYRVALLTGCIASVLFAKTNYFTAHVLAANGCEVVIPRSQGCCGALHAHSGASDQAAGFAGHNVNVFDPDNVDAIIVNSAGCGSTMKDYGHLMATYGDGADEEAVAKARTFAAKTKDVSEFLASIHLAPMPREVPITVAYHDACHLLHGQKVERQPRDVLAQVPGLRLVGLRDASLCCGSAGLYNILQPDMAESLLNNKVSAVLETDAAVVATGNPGCLMQIAKGLKERDASVQVLHPIDILARAYDIPGANA